PRQLEKAALSRVVVADYARVERPVEPVHIHAGGLDRLRAEEPVVDDAENADRIAFVQAALTEVGPAFGERDDDLAAAGVEHERVGLYRGNRAVERDERVIESGRVIERVAARFGVDALRDAV